MEGRGICNNSFFKSKTYLKMKKYIYVTIAACAVLLFSLQSCKKEEYKTPISGKESVISYSVSNGRLVFENKAKLNAKIEELSRIKLM